VASILGRVWAFNMRTIPSEQAGYNGNGYMVGIRLGFRGQSMVFDECLRQNPSLRNFSFVIFMIFLKCLTPRSVGAATNTELNKGHPPRSSAT